MLPTPEMTRLVEQQPLDPRLRAPHPALRTRRRRTPRRAGRGRCARSRAARSASRAPDTAVDEAPPNIRWSTNRSSGSAVGEAGSGVQVPSRTPVWRGGGHDAAGRSSGTPRGWTSIGRHAEVGEQGVARVERQPEVLPARRRAAVNVRPVSRSSKSAAPAACRRTGRGCSDLDAGDRPAETCASRPRRTTSTSGSSGIAGGRGAVRSASAGGRGRRPQAGAGSSAASVRYADSAACCSASFFERPTPWP